MVTPASIQCVLMRWRKIASASARCTRVLMPTASVGSAVAHSPHFQSIRRGHPHQVGQVIFALGDGWMRFSAGHSQAERKQNTLAFNS